MASGQPTERAADDVTVAGVELAAGTSGLKESGRPDLALIRLAEGTATAAMFTRNAFCAAPVQVARLHLEAGRPRVLLINSGCANAGTGAAGLRDAEATCACAGAACGVDASSVLPFSTGVIGPRLVDKLPLEDLCRAIEGCAHTLRQDAWDAAAEAILTTDTVSKLAWRTVELEGGTIKVTGIAKGSGMIRPDMATMLAFLATDARVERDALDDILRAAVNESFHAITVDGDTSTNDAVTLSATGAAEVGLDGRADRDAFRAAVAGVCLELAQAIVRDAEGATRLVEIEVSGGRDQSECREVAFTVAHSPLVKTALFGGDPNWGRILAAVGRARIAGLDVERVDIGLGEVDLVRGGQPVAGFDEAAAATVVRRDRVPIRIALGRGDAAARVWTSDLSYDYVRINADYRT